MGVALDWHLRYVLTSGRNSLSIVHRNSAIASYLKSQGYAETLECFQREADVVRSFPLVNFRNI